jgi:5-methyltetrahydropteroyltriglutamate--homocysteine methyltransferase
MSQLFPTELIGSYALPSWLWIATERAEERGDLGESDIKETLDDAVNMAVLDQQKAGIDILTDGEMRRRDFIQNFYGLMSGLNKISPKRTFGSAGYDQNPRYEVVNEVTAPNGLGVVEELEYLQTMTDQPFKICVPGPITLSLPLILKGGYPDKESLVAAMTQIVNAEMKALVSAGATYLQVDEPRYATTHEDAKNLITIFNKTRDGVDATVGLHFCFGNFKGRSHDKRNYSYITPNLGNANCDQFNFEFANREFAQIGLLEQLPADCKVGVGVVDVKSYFVETPEEVADSIRLAAKHVAPERIVVTPDCGFNHCPRHVAFGKMKSMVTGAAIVRKELAG